MITRRMTLALLGATLATPAFAGQAAVFTVGGNAIRGYDPVAYFTKGTPVMGISDHSTEHDGATWLFATAENKALFEADPAKYAPQYGGYCAYAVSKGSTAKTEPDAWAIVDDKLYLNYNKTVRSIWKQDIPGNIARADANWPGVLE